jgi:hypothetical protein
MILAMACPWAGPGRSVRRINRSSVPCSSSMRSRSCFERPVRQGPRAPHQQGVADADDHGEADVQRHAMPPVAARNGKTANGREDDGQRDQEGVGARQFHQQGELDVGRAPFRPVRHDDDRRAQQPDERANQEAKPTTTEKRTGGPPPHRLSLHGKRPRRAGLVTRGTGGRVGGTGHRCAARRPGRGGKAVTRRRDSCHRGGTDVRVRCRGGFERLTW